MTMLCKQPPSTWVGIRACDQWQCCTQSSRLPNFCTIFFRATGFLETGALKERNLWHKPYRNSPPYLYAQMSTSPGEPIPEMVNEDSQPDKRPESENRTNRSKARSIMELMRWHKPVGTILALTPSLWSVSLVTPETMSMPNFNTFAIFTAGAIVARGMGCTLNDILDRKYDRLVERTKNRPIACGDITTKEALLYLAIQSTVGLYVLCLNNLTVIKLGLFSGIMISAYPLFKRFTYWPQVMLALTMNWGVIMGYAAVKGAIHINDITTLLPIYLGSICWTLYYDTIYAHQDKTDDMFIGVKSSALRLGGGTKRFLNQMIGAMACNLTLAGALTGQLWPYYLSIASIGLFQANQVRKLILDDKEECWKMFDQQKYVGLGILGGVLASIALRSKLAKPDRVQTVEDSVS